MSGVWGMILQWGSTIKVSTELPVETRHGRDMTEKLLKATLNLYKQPLRIFIPHHTKSGWVFCYTLRKFWTFECLSVSTSFLDSNLSSFWMIFFKLCCMDNDIREEWFGIANGLNLFINNRVMALDWCKNCRFRTLTWVVFDQFSSNFAWALISGGSGLGLQLG